MLQQKSSQRANISSKDSGVSLPPPHILKAPFKGAAGTKSPSIESKESLLLKEDGEEDDFLKGK